MARYVALVLGTAIMTVFAITETQQSRTGLENGSRKVSGQPCICNCERGRNVAFEYKAVVHPFFDLNAPQPREQSLTAMENSLLNRYGSQGWRLVDVSSGTFIFERRTKRQAIAAPEETRKKKSKEIKNSKPKKDSSSNSSNKGNDSDREDDQE